MPDGGNERSAQFKYWCHFKAQFKDRQVESAAGIMRQEKVTEFEHVQEMADALMQMARQQDSTVLGVLLIGWTKLEDTPILLPPGVGRA